MMMNSSLQQPIDRLIAMNHLDHHSDSSAQSNTSDDDRLDRVY